MSIILNYTQDKLVVLHVSHGAIHTGQSILSITTLAASGSAWKLNSPHTVMFPSPWEFPPISIKRLIWEANPGLALIHAAKFVKGPRPITITSPLKVSNRFYCKFNSFQGNFCKRYCNIFRDSYFFGITWHGLHYFQYRQTSRFVCVYLGEIWSFVKFCISKTILTMERRTLMFIIFH